MGPDEKENLENEAARVFATAFGLAGAGFFPRLVYAELDPPIHLAHLGAMKDVSQPAAYARKRVQR
jgi:hypothetical protein